MILATDSSLARGASVSVGSSPNVADSKPATPAGRWSCKLRSVEHVFAAYFGIVPGFDKI